MHAPTRHAPSPPSPWLLRWAHLLTPESRVLDVACGSGRHVRWLAALGHRLTGIDRDEAALAALRDAPELAAAPGHAELIRADIEAGAWPCAGREFDAVVVTNYLWRPLWPQLLSALAPGGLLLYETFAAGNESVGRPARPEFLLQPGELLQRCAALQVVAYEDGFLAQPDRFVQRIVARRRDPAIDPDIDPVAGSALDSIARLPVRLPLTPPG